MQHFKQVFNLNVNKQTVKIAWLLERERSIGDLETNIWSNARQLVNRMEIEPKLW